MLTQKFYSPIIENKQEERTGGWTLAVIALTSLLTVMSYYGLTKYAQRDHGPQVLSQAAVSQASR